MIENASIYHAFLIGKEFDNVKLENAIHLDDAEELKEYLLEMDLQETAILVKGSRANKLERIQHFFKTI